MGCASSKQVEVAMTADVYRPPPASIALFDISKIDEPWLFKNVPAVDEKPSKPSKPTTFSLPLLEKIESLELAPKSWSEVSKALEDLKPSIDHSPPPTPAETPTKSSIHKGNTNNGHLSSPPLPLKLDVEGFRPVKENSFLVRDRQEREGKKDDELRRWRRRDPLESYPERPPPGNPEGIVLYTTTLRGVRRTFEDCERLRRLVEIQAEEAGVEVDERDVSLHGKFLKEVRELAGEGAAVPRLFVAGRYVGGVEEVEELAETGKLGEMMRWVGKKVGGEKGKGGRRECEGCGGGRFVPCLKCCGSCKVVAEDGKGVARCGVCNENGLVMCPTCH
ncbi:hypothetical protein KSP39_PZI014523 [Platanthera zijinensis]|uniref:Glutaredoxin domain-containing protein n=1 Tax=Platanthera zijinensis TaxID=2320716 RepID=A0AAP0BB59_9ASPA